MSITLDLIMKKATNKFVNDVESDLYKYKRLLSDAIQKGGEKKVEEKKPRPLTDREKKFVKYRADGCKVGESSLRAGFATPQYGTYLKAQEHIQGALQKALEDAGCTDEFVAKRLKEGADATHPERKSKEGVVLVQESPDFFIRHKHIETIMKAKGSLAQEGAVVKQQQINIIVTPEVAKGFLDSGVIDKKEHKDLKEYIEHEKESE